MLLPLELRHGAPVALGHVAHAEAGILPFLDCDGVVEPLPQEAVAGFRFIRRGHLEIRQGPDDRLAGDMEQGLFVGAVVEEKALVVKPGGKVPAQHGEHSVFRLNLASQHASQVRKADEAL